MKVALSLPGPRSCLHGEKMISMKGTAIYQISSASLRSSVHSQSSSMTFPAAVGPHTLVCVNLNQKAILTYKVHLALLSNFHTDTLHRRSLHPSDSSIHYALVESTMSKLFGFPTQCQPCMIPFLGIPRTSIPGALLKLILL